MESDDLSVLSVGCPKGQFRSGGLSQCTLCPAGEISASDGSTSCTKCSPGQTSNNARTTCGKMLNIFDLLDTLSLTTMRLDLYNYLVYRIRIGVNLKNR